MSDHHAQVLKRLAATASKDYPFPIPPRVEIPKADRLKLTNRANMLPVYRSMLRFLWNGMRPVFSALYALLGYVVCDTGSRTQYSLYTLGVLSVIGIIYDPFMLHFWSDGRFGLACSVEPKIYGASNPRNKRIMDKLQPFVHYVPTPYAFSGDWLTLLPFLWFKGSKGARVNYERYWIRVPEAIAPDGNDGPLRGWSKPHRTLGEKKEAVALDICFPTGGTDPTKPLLLILHGLNGGSTEPYVLDLVRRANAANMTAVVLIARGLSKTPLQGEELFTGARTSDVGAAVSALHAIFGDEVMELDKMDYNTRIVLVGFSMGAIIGANYTAKARGSCGIVGNLSFSGTLCGGAMLNATLPSNVHSHRVWQPALAWGLKATVIQPFLHLVLQRGITTKNVEAIGSVHELDSQLVCAYHEYPDCGTYYEDLSAAGRGDAKGLRRLRGAAVPLLEVHAMDDPIAVFEVAAVDLVGQTENVMVLATKHGGHIGWPLGWRPTKNRWGFMMDIAMEFTDAVCGVNGEAAR